MHGAWGLGQQAILINFQNRQTRCLVETFSLFRINLYFYPWESFETEDAIKGEDKYHSLSRYLITK